MPRPPISGSQDSIMRHDQSNVPFDAAAEAAADVTEEFWGDTRSWVSREHPAVEAVDQKPSQRRDDTTGSLRAIRDGLSAFRPRRVDGASRTDRTREHGIVRPDIAQEREATLGELAAGEIDEFDFLTGFDEIDPEPTARLTAAEARATAASRRDHAARDQLDDDLVPLTPTEPLAERLGLGTVDPLLFRLGAILILGILLVPLALALRGGDDTPSIQTGVGAIVPIVVAPAATASEPTVASQTGGSSFTEGVAQQTAASDEASTTASADLVETTVTADEPPVPTSAPTASDAPITPTSDDEAAIVSAIAERIVPECPQTYAAAAGDSWYRIADAAAISLAGLLDENRATLDTTILPGDEICLTAEATVPSALPTATPATTAPVTTDAPPTTQAAPATTAAPPPPPAPAEVERIIRDVWPDELEEKALQIAYRESRYRADAYNGWCCYGLFQIYWTVHDGWLDDIGVYSSNDLLDARKNTEAAYEIYRRAGGWGPWGG